MTLAELIKRAGGNLDREIYFLPTPESKDFIQAVSGSFGSGQAPTLEEDRAFDESGEELPHDAIILFPH